MPAFVALASLCVSACSSSIVPPPPISGKSKADHCLIAVPHGPISLGSLPPGRSASGLLTLKNESAGVIVIDRVEASCPCLSVSPLPARVEAGSEHSLTVAFDPTGEPDFRGRLSIELIGLADPGIVLFEALTTLEVLPGPTPAP